MGTDALTTIAIIASAIFFYRGAKLDGSSAVLWLVLSVGISILLRIFLHVGLLGIIFGQAGLFIGITIFRVVRES